jgi:hypothetical protein
MTKPHNPRMPQHTMATGHTNGRGRRGREHRFQPSPQACAVPSSCACVIGQERGGMQAAFVDVRLGSPTHPTHAYAHAHAPNTRSTHTHSHIHQKAPHTCIHTHTYQEAPRSVVAQVHQGTALAGALGAVQAGSPVTPHPCPHPRGVQGARGPRDPVLLSGLWTSHRRVGGLGRCWRCRGEGVRSEGGTAAACWWCQGLGRGQGQSLGQRLGRQR